MTDRYFAILYFQMLALSIFNLFSEYLQAACPLSILIFALLFFHNHDYLHVAL